MPLAALALDTPLGPLVLVSDGEAVVEATFDGTPPPDARPEADAVLAQATSELRAYFDGGAAAFAVPVRPAGTPFQERVWAALCDIPHGQTTSYGALATRLGDPQASQAVGAANGQNPIAILVPCHRVIGADGSLTGYAGGLERKRSLLALESPQTRLFG
ncbi:MAG: methylated-DNA--[protein]-cysteine S-methyltransferase [Bacteroidota bacterium]